MVAYLESQPRSFGIADVDALSVMDIDHRHPIAVEVGPVHRAVVDRLPAAVVEPQYQMPAGNPPIRDAQVGAQIAADDHVVACGEATVGPVMPNCQHRQSKSIHQTSIRWCAGYLQSMEL